MSRLPSAPVFALMLLAAGLAGCSKPSPAGTKQDEPAASASATAAASASAQPSTATPSQPKPDGTITITTFAVQKLDPSKAANPTILKTLAGVVRKYDVVAIQGIRDDTDAVGKKLLGEINAGQRGAYRMLLSEPTGRERNDERTRERYAFYYRNTRIDAYDEGQLFDDSAEDHFPREPFAAHFGVKGGGFSFVLITLRTVARRTLAELAAVPDVLEWARGAYPDQDDFILLGDLNADCRHASPEQLEELELYTAPYRWVVPHDSDSNVGEASCAYDRIVITEGAFDDYAGQWGVDRAFTDEAVSDRWPVWSRFHAARDKR